jgi:hypothetical protein
VKIWAISERFRFISFQQSTLYETNQEAQDTQTILTSMGTVIYGKQSAANFRFTKRSS